jgi:small subunit ribosomal protein S20
LANIKSQIKRNRQNDKSRLRNRVYRGEARIAVKDARTNIENGDADLSRKSVLEAISKLDKAAEKGVIHKNNAARRKSRLMKLLAKMEPVAPAAAATEPVVEVEEAKPAKRTRAKAEPKEEATPVEKKTRAKKAEKVEEAPKAKKTTTKKPTAKK